MKKRKLAGLESPEMDELERKGNAMAKQACLEGSVLLVNDGILPLAPQPIALFGFGARRTLATGIGSGDVEYRYQVNVEEGLKNNGFTIVTEE